LDVDVAGGGNHAMLVRQHAADMIDAFSVVLAMTRLVYYAAVCTEAWLLNDMHGQRTTEVGICQQWCESASKGNCGVC
jgi:hypothetical protein